MKNTFGNALNITIFGESHGEAIGAILDGIAPGIKINEEYIKQKLFLRRPQGKISTARREMDEFEIISGVFNGFTTGTPLCIIIRNTNKRSQDYDNIKRLARPSHADLTAFYKYQGFEDFRGGGHFSGRITVALVAVGAIVLYALEQKGIKIGTHISRCAKINDREFIDYSSDIEKVANLSFPVLEEAKAKEMHDAILKASDDGDSVGGILETAVINFPEGIGEPFFDSVESMLSHMLFSVPAIKGIEFGKGFDISDMKGSEANDQFCNSEGKIITLSNNNGGINGGITNGMPLLFRCAVKPTPSIFKPQKTIDIHSRENAVLNLTGRHDPAIIHRVAIVVNCVTAFVLGDLLTIHYGTNFLGGKHKCNMDL